MRKTSLFTALLLGLGATLPLAAQEHETERSVISVTAAGTVEIPADFAILTLGVIVQDSTPTLAASGMDLRLRAVTDTLVILGVPPESLPTAHYNVTPNRDRTQIIGYSANSAVRLAVGDIARLPALIEAALGAGATDVTGLQFGASEERQARDEALRRAIAEARHDAEVIAEAAGGRLGVLLEASTQPASIRQARVMEYAAPGGPAPQITPRDITVVANVSVRWKFLEN
jgi:uncharacterized protein YggE